MTTPPLQRQGTALLGMALVLCLVACSRPGRDRATPPTAAPSPTAAPPAEAASPAQREQLLRFERACSTL